VIGPRDLAAVVQQISEDPAVLGLGDLELKRVSRHPGQASLLLEDRVGSILYVVELQPGAADDRHLIRAVERWAAERKRHPRNRCYAVVVAQEIAPRYRNILQVIGKAVPVVAMEMRTSENAAAAPRFTPVPLGLH
jgi:hypothetical protein